MSRVISLFLLLALVAVADPTVAVPRRARVVMPDTSELIGELTALPDGRYRLKSGEQGDLLIEDGNAVSITYLDDADAVDGEAVAVNRAVDALTRQAAETGATERIGSGIQGLHAELERLEARAGTGELTPAERARLDAYAKSGNPADLGVQGLEWLDGPIMEIMNDPELMQAAKDGNYLKLMTSDKVQRAADGSAGMRQLVDMILQRPMRDPLPAAKPTAEAEAAPATTPTEAETAPAATDVAPVEAE